MKDIVKANDLCVLATVSEGKPHCSLMSYISDDEGQEIYLVSHKQTKKYFNFATLLKSQGVGDLFRLYVFAQRDQFDYNLAYIPPDFTPRPSFSFDTAYMNTLFQFGYQLACWGQPWHKYPPGYEPVPLGA